MGTTGRIRAAGSQAGVVGSGTRHSTLEPNHPTRKLAGGGAGPAVGTPQRALGALHARRAPEPLDLNSTLEQAAANGACDG
jgi:hypothetical protein